MSSPEDKNKDSWGTLGGGNPQRPQFMQDQAANLIRLRDLLQATVGQKQAEVQSLQEKLHRLQHGGGS